MKVFKISSQKGLTMIELMVVIAITAIIAGIVIPQINFGRSRFRDTVFNLKAHMMQAKSEAVRRNENVRVSFNQGAGSYTLQTVTTGKTLLTVNLDPSITLAANYGGSNSTRFNPRGNATNGNVSLTYNTETITVFTNNAGKIWTQ